MREKRAGKHRRGSSAADALEMEQCVSMARHALESGEPHWAALVALGAGFGLRVSDALALTWADLMSDGHVRPRIVIRERKNQAQREVRPFPWVVEVLEAAYRAIKPRPEDPIVPVTRQHAWWIIRRLAEDLGLKRKGRTLSPHSLRKAFCTWVYDQTHDPLVACVLTGHRNPMMLLRYIGRVPTKAEEILMAMATTKF